MIRTLLITLAAGLTVSAATAQTPSFQGALNNTAGTQTNSIYQTVTDASGNILFCGKHPDVLTIDGQTLATGSGGAYFGKMDASGNLLWLRQGGTTSGNDAAYGIACDANSNIYIVGALGGPTVASFGGISLGSTYPGFVAKYNSSGTALWAVGIGGTGYSIAVTSSNEPVVNIGDGTISYFSSADGSQGVYTTLGGNLMNPFYHNIVADNNNNVFAQAGNKIVKYDNALNVIWSTPVTSSLMETYRINLDASGNVYGAFYALFGSVTIGSFTKSNFPNGFIYKLDGSTGTALFCDSILIAGAVSKIKEVLPAANGDYYISGDGAFNSPHVLRMTSSYATTWIKPLPTNAPANDIVELTDDCLYVVGVHSGTSVFDTYTLNLPSGAGSIDNGYLTGLCNGTISVPELGDKLTLSVYPNPAADMLHVSDYSNNTLRVVNALGQAFSLKAVSEGNFDLSKLAPGIYFIDGGVGKFIKD